MLVILKLDIYFTRKGCYSLSYSKYDLFTLVKLYADLEDEIKRIIDSESPIDINYIYNTFPEMDKHKKIVVYEIIKRLQKVKDLSVLVKGETDV